MTQTEESGFNPFSVLKTRLIAYHNKVNWIVFCFIFCFTIGAWLDINGLWCELPIMVHVLPEKWQLPAILSASTQIAQIGPCVFLIGRKLAPRFFTFTNAIYVILGIGALSCFLLSFFWDSTGYIFGSEHSIGLIILNFSLAILDGTSSVTFMPYIGLNFAKEYLIPNYIGESLAALIPSVLSLIQGLGQDPGCYNYTDPVTNITELTPITIVPTYSVQLYFLFMFGLLCISTTSFSLLNFSAIAIRNRKPKTLNDNHKEHSLTDESSKEVSSTSSISDTSKNQELNEVESSPAKAKAANAELMSDSQVPLNQSSISNSDNNVEVSSGSREEFILLTFTFFLSFFCYGVLPGLQSYSTLPYGNNVFNLAVNLSFIILPVSIILSIWSYDVSVLQISIEFLIATLFGVYIIVLSWMSPCPPLLDTWIGPTLSVAAWVLVQSMYMRIRCLIAARLQRFGQRSLLILGFLTMVGQIFGGLLVFVLVTIYEMLISKPECVTDFSYCK